jgi:hypothetical protein
MNIAPAFFDIKLRTYVAATFLGISRAPSPMPGSARVSTASSFGRRGGREISIRDLVTPEITIAFAGLAIVAAIPTIVRKFRRSRLRHRTGQHSRQMGSSH